MRKHGTMILLILIPVLILGLVSVMSNIVSNKNIKSVNNSASEIADNSMLSIEALGEIRQDTQSLHTQALSHIVATDLDSMLDIVEGLRDTQSGLAASLDEYEQFVSADDKDNFQALKDGIDQFNYHLADLLAFSGAGENEKAYALANGELSDSADNVEAVAAKLIASATAGADNARSDLNNVSQDSVRLTMVLILVSAAEEELKRYRELSAKLKKQCHVDSSGKVTMSEQGKKIAIERARLIAGAENKVYLLKKIISEKYLKDTHMLIYCGAARNYNPSLDSSETDEEGERQIVSVSKMLGNELGMKVTHFTSAESAQERSRIKTQFANADPYQAIVAIKCLDEGVNIPSIKTAFILASSTNPKEYIQRRGRVLRKYKGKKFAVIYDFVTLPTAIDDVQYGSDGSNFDLSLVKREMVRMKEFGEISMNPADTDKLISELSDAYGMDIIDLDEGVYDYE